jgi:hypothetical protein
MVRVNNKPQHIVFCWYFAHLLSKHRHLPVESCKRPCLARGRTLRFAPKSGQTLGFGPIRVPLSKRSPSQASSQGAELVQNRAAPVRIVEIGDPSPAQFPAARDRTIATRRERGASVLFALSREVVTKQLRLGPVFHVASLTPSDRLISIDAGSRIVPVPGSLIWCSLRVKRPLRYRPQFSGWELRDKR